MFNQNKNRKKNCILLDLCRRFFPVYCCVSLILHCHCIFMISRTVKQNDMQDDSRTLSCSADSFYAESSRCRSFAGFAIESKFSNSILVFTALRWHISFVCIKTPPRIKIVVITFSASDWQFAFTDQSTVFIVYHRTQCTNRGKGAMRERKKKKKDFKKPNVNKWTANFRRFAAATVGHTRHKYHSHSLAVTL